jgi:hypothetical protein
VGQRDRNRAFRLSGTPTAPIIMKADLPHWNVPSLYKSDNSGNPNKIGQQTALLAEKFYMILSS